MKEWLAVAGGYSGGSLHNAGERGEKLTHFPGVFEPVVIAFSVAVVAHHIGQPERGQVHCSRVARFCRPRGRSRWGSAPCSRQAVRRRRTRPDCRARGTDAIAYSCPLPRGFLYHVFAIPKTWKEGLGVTPFVSKLSFRTGQFGLGSAHCGAAWIRAKLAPTGPAEETAGIEKRL